jgi:DNA-binding NtrC family response regulator
MGNILIIDDDKGVRGVLEAFFSDEGFDVSAVPDGESGLRLLKQMEFDIIFLDLVMPGMGGLEVLKELSKLKNDIPCIMMTGFATTRSAVDAMKLGAIDYITKPFNLEELLIITKRVIDMTRVVKENIALKKQLSGLLHVCSWCNRIRDDKGQWKSLEEYIKERENAVFSHGICPQCLKKNSAKTDGH